MICSLAADWSLTATPVVSWPAFTIAVGAAVDGGCDSVPRDTHIVNISNNTIGGQAHAIHFDAQGQGRNTLSNVSIDGLNVLSSLSQFPVDIDATVVLNVYAGPEPWSTGNSNPTDPPQALGVDSVSWAQQKCSQPPPNQP